MPLLLYSAAVTLQYHCYFRVPLLLYSGTVTLQCHCYCTVTLLLYSASYFTVTQCHCYFRVPLLLYSVTVTLQYHCYFTVPLLLYSATVTSQCHCYFTVPVLLYGATVTLQCHALSRCTVTCTLIATDLTPAVPAELHWNWSINVASVRTNSFALTMTVWLTGIIIPRLLVKDALPNFKKLRQRV